MNPMHGSGGLGAMTVLIGLALPAVVSAEDGRSLTGATADLWSVLAFLIGAFAGMAEILSRYRDEPWKAAFGGPGLIYIAVNGLISMGVYRLVLSYPILSAISKPGFPVALAAGLGSMAVFRSKVFVYSTDNGNEYPIGPDIVLDIFMKTIDRQVDRKQAIRRQKLITAQMSGVADFDKAAEYFSTAILSFQHLTPEESEKWKGEIDRLKESSLPNTVKLLALGYTLLNLTGEAHFQQSVSELKKYASREG